MRKVSLMAPRYLTRAFGQVGMPFNRVLNTWAGEPAQREGNHELVLDKLGLGMSGEHQEQMLSRHPDEGVWRSEERAG